MVTVHREAGLSFVSFTDDHPPAHIHVVGDGRAKIELVGEDGRPRLVNTRGFAASDIRRALRIVAERQDELLARRRSIHG